MHAEVCPLCGGTGKKENWNPQVTAPLSETCHGCGGLGWISVPDEGGSPSPPPAWPWPHSPWNPTYSPYPPSYPYDQWICGEPVDIELPDNSTWVKATVRASDSPVSIGGGTINMMLDDSAPWVRDGDHYSKKVTCCFV